jgi:hypothetical protein
MLFPEQKRPGLSSIATQMLIDNYLNKKKRKRLSRKRLIDTRLVFKTALFSSYVFFSPFDVDPLFLCFFSRSSSSSSSKKTDLFSCDEKKLASVESKQMKQQVKKQRRQNQKQRDQDRRKQRNGKKNKEYDGFVQESNSYSYEALNSEDTDAHTHVLEDEDGYEYTVLTEEDGHHSPPGCSMCGITRRGYEYGFYGDIVWIEDPYGVGIIPRGRTFDRCSQCQVRLLKHLKEKEEEKRERGRQKRYERECGAYFYLYNYY